MREQDDGQSVIAAGAGVKPPAGQFHSTVQLLQQQTDKPQVCEGEVSQFLPSCCCHCTGTAPNTPHSALCTMQYIYTKLTELLLLLIITIIIIIIVIIIKAASSDEWALSPRVSGHAAVRLVHATPSVEEAVPL